MPYPTAAPQTIREGNVFEGSQPNPESSALGDHLSTFSLDVDTGAYTVFRRYINTGMLPPPESVRVEEYVNYFDPGYPTPRDTAFAVYADGAPSPFNGELLARFGVQGYPVSERERKPLALTFVVDCSGSMNRENRIQLVKDTLNVLVDRLNPDDTVAIVAYNTTASVILEPTRASDWRRIRFKLDKLEPAGNTNLQQGLQFGYDLANQGYREEASNRIILASDGVANVGDTSPEGILASVEEYARSGIALSTLGVGMGNFNDALLEQLADRGDGTYAYIDDLDEARRLFVDNLAGATQTIAMNARVQVDFNTDVVGSYRLIGYENRAIADQDFRDDSVDAGEINAGQSATAIYAIQLRPGAQGRIATISLRWEDPDSAAPREINGNFNTWDVARRFEDADPRFQLAATVAQTAEILRASPYASGAWLDQVYPHAERLARQLDDPEVAEFARLLEQARWME
jgi:Ca-activated chloride channel family protein